MEYYIVRVFGCVDPEPLIGPFKTYDGMRKRAVKVRAGQDDEDAIFWLRTAPGEKPLIASFTNADLGVDTD